MFCKSYIWDTWSIESYLEIVLPSQRLFFQAEGRSMRVPISAILSLLYGLHVRSQKSPIRKSSTVRRMPSTKRAFMIVRS